MFTSRLRELKKESSTKYAHFYLFIKQTDDSNRYASTRRHAHDDPTLAKLYRDRGVESEIIYI